MCVATRPARPRRASRKPAYTITEEREREREREREPSHAHIITITITITIIITIISTRHTPAWSR